ncbi:MAG TPA: DUF2721 domain-containing protein [Cyclobacteriaceae bacterium]
MNISLTTPALLFPAISLLLLAYTNRFLAIASMIRQLHTKYLQNPGKGVLVGQIKNLRDRLHLIRSMQLFGVLSFFLCVLSMTLIYQNIQTWGSYIFGGSLILLLISLFISLREIQISTRALELELSDMELIKK